MALRLASLMTISGSAVQKNIWNAASIAALTNAQSRVAGAVKIVGCVR
jgi:hypothetical protein